MYKRVSAILLPIVLLALIGTGVWGYQQNQDKNTIMIKAENQYQRAFHDLSYNMDKLHTELGNTLALQPTTQNFYRKRLSNVWRMSNQAQNDIGQLPLTMLPLNKTQEFLDHLSKFAYLTSIRDLSSHPLSDGEHKTLENLYTKSKELNAQLGTVQNRVIAQNLRWMDVDTALASQKQNMDNVIVDGFRAVDKRVEGYSDVDWGPSVNDITARRKLSALPGKPINTADAMRKAEKFLGMQASADWRVTENGKGTDYHSYTVTGSLPGMNHGFHMDISHKGGHMLMYNATRPAAIKRLDTRGARDAALDFLDRKGFGDMVPVAYDEYQNIGSITFASRRADTVLYPEKVSVNVALDNGDITGLQASEYHFEHGKNRKTGKARITVEQARKQLNPTFEVYSHDQALIKNDINAEVLCHEFTGKVNGSVYKVYLNADTGDEEKTELLRGRDSLPLK
jgi:spore germination protein